MNQDIGTQKEAGPRVGEEDVFIERKGLQEEHKGTDLAEATYGQEPRELKRSFDKDATVGVGGDGGDLVTRNT